MIMTTLRILGTPIPGLLLVRLPVHGDDRGWFKENWQRKKMIALGLPDFEPVQHNISFNVSSGVTRGLHAEPWDKYVSVAHGRVFGAWVDLRAGVGFGTSFSHEIGPDIGVFVPRGVANGFQTLEAETVYSYLVNDHWEASERTSHSFLDLADSTAAIRWPIPQEDWIVSDADQGHPSLDDVTPINQP